MKLIEFFTSAEKEKIEDEVDWIDDLKFYMDNNDHILSQYFFPAVKKHQKYKDREDTYKIYVPVLYNCIKQYCSEFNIKDPETKFTKDKILDMAKKISTEQQTYIDRGDYEQK